MAYAMTKQGSLDNCITYEFICDTISDMNAIENRYRTIGTVAIVLRGENEGLEVYIAGSDRQWNNLTSMGASDSSSENGSLSIHICGLDEVTDGLPNTAEPDANTIYLVPGVDETNDIYEEYIYVNDAWEKFGAGALNIDFSAYATKNNPTFTGAISKGREANSIVGNESTAIGSHVIASSSYSHAEGYYSEATRWAAHAEGSGAKAYGDSSHAEGQYTIAKGAASHVVGKYNKEDDYSNWTEWVAGTSYAKGAKVKRTIDGNARGYICTTANSDSSFTYSHWQDDDKLNYVEIVGNGTAINRRANARTLDWNGNEFLAGSLKLGYATVTGIQALGIGNGTTASGNYSVSIGGGATASGDYSIALGGGCTASGNYSITTGNGNQATAIYAQAHGFACTASAQGAYAQGGNNTASGSYTHAEGFSTSATTSYAHAEGSGTTASGYGAHAEGIATLARGAESHAEGQGGTFTLNNITYTSQAAGAADHVEGYYCMTASGQPGNHAEGYNTRATGGAAHSEGSTTLASGVHSHAEGTETIASEQCTHAENYHTTASGANSHAEGYYTIADEYNSHAEGYYTVAAGRNSHVGGRYNVADSYDGWPAWTPNTSYGVGDKVKLTVISSDGTTIKGYKCTNSNNDASFTESKWTNLNNEMNYIEIIGNGTADNARSNARALDWDGNEHLKGDLYVGCNADSTGGTKVATIADIDPIENVSGSTPSITGVANTRYICEEVSTLSITPPQTGIIDVRFDSGTTPTVLTVPNTVKFPVWFDKNNLEANTTYEINITDGVYAAVMLWQ